MKNFFSLLITNLYFSLWRIWDFIRDCYTYYYNLKFLRIDLSLRIRYLFQNPFKISKKYLIQKGETEIYTYGETPLATLDHIVKKCDLTTNDSFYELGCGRGRACFWVQCFVGCRVVGIDFVPSFITIADQVRVKHQLERIEFRLGNFVDADFTDATCVYLYALFMDNNTIITLIEKLLKHPRQIKVITVSFPLTDYHDTPEIQVICQFQGSFPWGKTEIYLQKITPKACE